MRLLIFLVTTVVAVGCGGTQGPETSATIELRTGSIAKREALGKIVLKDLAKPRLQQLLRERVPDATGASVDGLCVELVSESREENGPVSRMYLRCSFSFEEHTPTALDRRLLDACVEEVNEALKRATNNEGARRLSSAANLFERFTNEAAQARFFARLT